MQMINEVHAQLLALALREVQVLVLAFYDA
jgi:hypothetical protein